MSLLPIEPKRAEKYLDMLETQFRNRFEEIQAELITSGAKGAYYEEHVKRFYEYFLGDTFIFFTRFGILDIELKVDSVLGKANNFDIVAVYKSTVPKLKIMENFVPYDSVAFITQIKQSLRLRELEKDLIKLNKLNELKVSKGRFRRYTQPKYTGVIDSIEGIPRPLRILFYYEGLSRKTSQKKAGKILFDSYESAWDIFITLKKHPVVFLNKTLPLVNKVVKYFLHSNKYPLVHAVYAICLSAEGYFVDSSAILLNLLRSYLK